MTTMQKQLLQLAGLMAIGVLAGWLLFHQVGVKEEKAEKKKAAARVFTISDPATVVSLELTTSEGRFRVERQDDGWRLTAPIETRAEKSTIDTVLRHLVDLERSRRVGENRPDGSVEPPKDLWIFALSPPRYTVALVDNSGATTTLEVGKKNQFDGSIYVKLADAPDISLVDGSLEYQVDKDLYQLRDKTLFAFAEDQVSRFSIGRPGKAEMVIERQEGDYHLVAPRAFAADRQQVTGILSALANLRAAEFVGEAATAEELRRHALDQPSVRVELTTEGSSHTLLLSRQRVGKEDAFFACRGLGHPILRVGSDWAFKKIEVDADALRDKHLLRFEREEVGGLTLEKAGKRLEFVRSRDEDDTRDLWRMTAPESAAADDAALAGILYRLGNLEAESIMAEEAHPDILVATGLAEPEVQVELFDTDGETIGEVSFAAEVEGARLATSSQTNRVDRVDAAVASELSDNPQDYLRREADEVE